MADIKDKVNTLVTLLPLVARSRRQTQAPPAARGGTSRAWAPSASQQPIVVFLVADMGDKPINKEQMSLLINKLTEVDSTAPAPKISPLTKI
jgi:hypothetical protein